MARTPRARRGNRILVIFISILVLVGLVSSAVVVTGLVKNPLARFTATATATVTPHPTVPPTPTAIPTATPIALNTNVPHVNAAGVELLDAVTGQELYGRGATDKLAMASTTKIMTALVTLLSATPLDQPVTVGNEIVGLDANSASLMNVSQGQIYTVRELLYGLLLPSGDDAALVLAKAIGGSQAAFVARMNTMAAFLGLTATSFINPNGLDDNMLSGANVTSAHDLAILAAFAMQNATFRQIVATPTYTVPATATHDAIPMDTTNEFLSNKAHTKSGYDFTSQGTTLGIDGIKTGFTGLAGYCLVVEARFRSHTVILVELKEPSLNTDATFEQRFVDATNLLKWLEPQYQ